MGAPILSITSQVTYGHVGNSAAAFALQRLGHPVWAVPTVLYSNHPGYGRFEGSAVPADEMAALVRGLDGLGVLGALGAVLTGYLRAPEQVEAAAEAVGAVQRANPGAVYCCDPVVGDRHTGLYVPESAAAAVRRKLVPAARIVTPNAFELGYLTEREIRTADDALRAAQDLRKEGPDIVVCTSITEDADLRTLAVTGRGAFIVRTPAFSSAPHGAGDLFAALFLARFVERADVADALGIAVSITYSLIARASEQNLDELPLVAAQDQLVAPDHAFSAEPA